MICKKFNNKLQILKLNSQFFNILNMSKYIVDPFILYYKENIFNYSRLSYSINKKKIKYAHERNLIKRIIREFFINYQYAIHTFDIFICLNRLINLNILKLESLKRCINTIFKFLIVKSLHRRLLK